MFWTTVSAQCETKIGNHMSRYVAYRMTPLSVCLPCGWLPLLETFQTPISRKV